MADGKSRFGRTVGVLTFLMLAAGLAFAADQAREIRQGIDVTNANTNFTTWNSVARQ
jgi:hypothetical protein